MKTDDLIRLLATRAGPAPDRMVGRRVGAALLAGVATSVVACLVTLGVNPALATMGLPLMVKLTYAAGVLGAAGWWLSRVARPAASAWRATVALAGVVGAMAVWATHVWLDVPVGGRVADLFGPSWASCPWRVAVLSLPALAFAIWALRGLAPTRPRLAGFVAGLVGGAAGAVAYALFCSEASPAFVLVWYSLGMLMPAGAGAWLGPRLLRW